MKSPPKSYRKIIARHFVALALLTFALAQLPKCGQHRYADVSIELLHRIVEHFVLRLHPSAALDDLQFLDGPRAVGRLQLQKWEAVRLVESEIFRSIFSILFMARRYVFRGISLHLVRQTVKLGAIFGTSNELRRTCV